MADVKGERLEIRLSAGMMRQLKSIAPKDARGRPNVSELVRQALHNEIQRHSLSRMADWARTNRD
ncbi:hypothetical protein GF324_07695, partial [bacterium]|nr:hypothetical protein [bacterium]